MRDEAPKLDRAILRDLFWFNASLGARRFVKGIDYVRVVEYPVFAAVLLRVLAHGGSYLDIGSGKSLLPAYVATRTPATVVALDKFMWVEAQRKYLGRLRRSELLASGRFSIVKEDFLQASALHPGSFDAVSAVSVLEHIDGDGDSRAMRKVFELLRPGGTFIVSCPFDAVRGQDFRVDGSVYGAASADSQTFFQRHYSTDTLKSRLMDAAPFELDALFYAGHYAGRDMARAIYFLPWPWKAAKVAYNWATPFYVPRFLTLSTDPPVDRDPQMLTANTAFLVLRKPS
jgi:SAM-dependent methyltransferase